MLEYTAFPSFSIRLCVRVTAGDFRAVSVYLVIRISESRLVFTEKVNYINPYISYCVLDTYFV